MIITTRRIDSSPSSRRRAYKSTQGLAVRRIRPHLSSHKLPRPAIKLQFRMHFRSNCALQASNLAIKAVSGIFSATTDSQTQVYVRVAELQSLYGRGKKKTCTAKKEWGGCIVGVSSRVTRARWSRTGEKRVTLPGPGGHRT